jgi:hypothetical protein
MPEFHLAQLNVGRARKPMEDPLMADFVNQLDEINALAERSPGFIWRLQDDAGNATSFQVFDDPLIFINLSVWEDLKSLKDFTYRTAHVKVMRQRKKWFEHFGKPYLVLWWIPAGHIPTPTEAKSKLECLQQKGATMEAFDFKTTFGPLPK